MPTPARECAHPENKTVGSSFLCIRTDCPYPYTPPRPGGPAARPQAGNHETSGVLSRKVVDPVQRRRRSACALALLVQLSRRTNCSTLSQKTPSVSRQAVSLRPGGVPWTRSGVTSVRLGITCKYLTSPLASVCHSLSASVWHNLGAAAALVLEMTIPRQLK